MSSLLPSLTSTPDKKPPITCHVLNTVTGLPASGISVSLILMRPYGPSSPLTSTTNADGRVTSWTSPAGGPSLDEIFANAQEHAATSTSTSTTDGEGIGQVALTKEEQALEVGEMVWALKFDVGSYFQGEGFWEVVEVRFRTRVEKGGREHWHVPLLLSPYAYSTYRGS